MKGKKNWVTITAAKPRPFISRCDKRGQRFLFFGLGVLYAPLGSLKMIIRSLVARFKLDFLTPPTNNIFTAENG